MGFICISEKNDDIQCYLRVIDHPYATDHHGTQDTEDAISKENTLKNFTTDELSVCIFVYYFFFATTE